MCGGWIPATFRETVDCAFGYNKKLYVDDDTGSVTNIVIEFQISDGNYTKCLVASFENGDDGVYATAINARYTSGAIGFTFRDYNGTLYGAANNSSGETFAETLTASGYGVFDVRVAVPTEWTLDADRTWSELRNGETLSTNDYVRITVTDADAMLTIDENVEVFRIEFVDGDGATMTVASGKTVISEVIEGVGHILNNGVLVKTGAGTLELPFDRDSAGETVVSNGTVKVASVTGTGTSHQVRVASGATFDVNAIQNIHVVLRLEAGATYTNGKQYSGNLYNVYPPVRLILDGDATATATYSFGLATS